jgi:hypothetical protein
VFSGGSKILLRRNRLTDWVSSLQIQVFRNHVSGPYGTTANNLCELAAGVVNTPPSPTK